MMAGRCVQYLQDRARLQAERSELIDPLLSRGSTLDSALAVLALPTPRPTQARDLREQADRLTQEIEALRTMLVGRPTQAWLGRDRAEVLQQLTEMTRERSRKALLARAYALEGKERVALLERLRVEKQELTERIDLLTQPYEQRLSWLQERVGRHGDAFKDAMRGFARIDEVHGINIQAARLHTVISEGRLSFNWTDARGDMVASAYVWLRARPDKQLDPPLILGRYPVLLQGREETQISAGHFLIEFRVDVDELKGEARVLEIATRLLDIDGLGRLVPRLGSKGLD